MIDFDRWLIAISSRISKSNRDRAVPVEPARLRAFLQTRRFLPSETFVFGTRTGKPVVEIKTAWQRVRTQAGSEDLCFHDLRHECASRLLANGYDVAIVRDVLGHRSIAVTNRYLNTRADDLRHALRSLNSRPAWIWSARAVLRSDLADEQLIRQVL